MSAHMTVTGNLGGEPALRFTQSGQAVLELNIAATPRRHDKATDRWEDDGDPLWITAPIWGRDAETLAEAGLAKGAKVSVEGTLRLRSYDRRDGGRGQSLELAGARFLGVVPKGRAANAPQARGEAPRSAYQPAPVSTVPASATRSEAPSVSDPWGAAQSPFPDDVPF